MCLAIIDFMSFTDFNTSMLASISFRITLLVAPEWSMTIMFFGFSKLIFVDIVEPGVTDDYKFSCFLNLVSLFCANGVS